MSSKELDIKIAESDPLRHCFSLSEDFEETIAAVQFSAESPKHQEAPIPTPNISLLSGEKLVFFQTNFKQAPMCVLILTPSETTTCEFYATNYRVMLT